MHNVQSIYQHAVGLSTELCLLTHSDNSAGRSLLPAGQLRDLTRLQADLQNAVLKGQVKLRTVVQRIQLRGPGAGGGREMQASLQWAHTGGHESNCPPPEQLFVPMTIYARSTHSCNCSFNKHYINRMFFKYYSRFRGKRAKFVTAIPEPTLFLSWEHLFRGDFLPLCAAWFFSLLYLINFTSKKKLGLGRRLMGIRAFRFPGGSVILGIASLATIPESSTKPHTTSL